MPATTNVLDGGIVINEWLRTTDVDHNGDGSTTASSENSYIEIANISGAPIDISSYALWTYDNDTATQALFHTVPGGTMLGAGETYTVVSDAPAGGGVPTGFGAGTAVVGNFNVASGNNNMFLVDATGNNYIVLGTTGGAAFLNADIAAAGLGAANQVGIDVVTDGSEGFGESFQREPDGEDGFVTGATTPGTNNMCFVGGTQIDTPEGERLVEALEIGDLVTTADGRAVLVKWVGRQNVSRPANVMHSERLAPVCIKAGTLGNHSDLYVSADHGMIVDGAVINAAALVNGDTVRFVPAAELPEAFTYYHIETTGHEVILANGAPAETFIDAAGRAAFDNHQEYLDLYGAERIIPEMRLPRISSARLVPQEIRDRLAGKCAQTVSSSRRVAC